MEWNGDQVRARLVERLRRNMTRAVLFVEGQVKTSISRPNRRGHDPSLPGEPPKRRQGQLRANVATEVLVTATAVRGFVGIRKGSTAEKYGRALELGFHGTVPVRAHTGYRFNAQSPKTKRGSYVAVPAGTRTVNLQARPYLRPGVTQNAAAIASRIAGRR